MNYDEIEKEYNISPLVVELLEKRGIDNKEKLNKFLNPTDKDFYDPFLLSGMDKLVERVSLAIKNNEKVLIFGDYDVDGVSATAILMKYFASQNFYVDYYLPNRYIDGYGLTNDTLLKVKELYSPSLIITVDCGISCYAEVEFAKTIGIDIIITDHHDIPEIIPDTIVVNAKLDNQLYPFKFLCGTGVAFKIVQALSSLEEAKKYLGIAAIATIADIVPLQDENRAIVKLGMRDFEKNLPLGIKMLFEENKLQLSASSTDIAFKLTPKINAAGRMGDAGVALKLYIKNDKIFLKNTIETLGNLNTQRQALCNKVYEDAIEMLSKINIANYNAIVLFSKNWDSGILGIVASRIASEFNRPTILFSEIGEDLKGSARSVNDIDIFSAISSLKEVLEAFGGHRMAAGLTIKKKNFNRFMQNLNSYLATNYTSKDFLPANKFDAVLDNNLSSKLVSDLELLEPCGCGNPKPIFNICLGENATFSPMPKHPNHLTIYNDNLNIIAFNSYKYLLLLRNTTNREIQVELQESIYKNKKYIKGIAKNISTGSIAKIKNPDYISGEYLKQLFYKEENGKTRVCLYDKAELKQHILQAKQELFGTLFISYSYASYKEFCDIAKNANFQHHVLELISNSGLNSIVLAPGDFTNFGAYKKIVFLDPILSKGYLDKLSTETSATIYAPNAKPITNTKVFRELRTDRLTFGMFFKLLSNFASKQESFYNDISLFKQICSKEKKLNYNQFIFCLYVFVELNIFKIESEMGLLTLRENKKIVSSLTSSSFYNKMVRIISDNRNKG